jgi:hypothetical protein
MNLFFFIKKGFLDLDSISANEYIDVDIFFLHLILLNIQANYCKYGL